MIAKKTVRLRPITEQKKTKAACSIHL